MTSTPGKLCAYSSVPSLLPPSTTIRRLTGMELMIAGMDSLRYGMEFLVSITTSNLKSICDRPKPETEIHAFLILFVSLPVEQEERTIFHPSLYPRIRDAVWESV